MCHGQDQCAAACGAHLSQGRRAAVADSEAPPRLAVHAASGFGRRRKGSGCTHESRILPVPVGASTSKFWYDESPHAPQVKPELGDVVGGGACARVGAHRRRAAKEEQVKKSVVVRGMAHRSPPRPREATARCVRHRLWVLCVPAAHWPPLR